MRFSIGLKVVATVTPFSEALWVGSRHGQIDIQDRIKEFIGTQITSMQKHHGNVLGNWPTGSGGTVFGPLKLLS